jgi:hypothetical protein
MNKVRIDADLLTARDMRRARTALGGKDPWEVLRGEQEDRAVLIAWCLLSRDDPALTLEQVEEMPFGDFIEVDEEEDERPSQEPRSSTNGSGPAKTETTPTAGAASK